MGKWWTRWKAMERSALRCKLWAYLRYAGLQIFVQWTCRKFCHCYFVCDEILDEIGNSLLASENSFVQVFSFAISGSRQMWLHAHHRQSLFWYRLFSKTNTSIFITYSLNLFFILHSHSFLSILLVTIEFARPDNREYKSSCSLHLSYSSKDVKSVWNYPQILINFN